MSQNVEEMGWEPTRKEYEDEEGGVKKITKVIYEQKKKKLLGIAIPDMLDILVKTAGVIAIFIPLITISYTNRMDSKAKDRNARASLFGIIIKNYTNIFRHPDNIVAAIPTIDSVNTLLESQLNYANNDQEMFNGVNELNNDLYIYTDMYKRFQCVDSLEYYVDGALQFINEVQGSGNTKQKLIRELQYYQPYINFLNYYASFHGLILKSEYDSINITKDKDELRVISDSLKQYKGQWDTLFLRYNSYFGGINTMLNANASLSRSGDKYVDSIFIDPVTVHQVNEKLKERGPRKDEGIKGKKLQELQKSALELKTKLPAFLESLHRQFMILKSNIRMSLKA